MQKKLYIKTYGCQMNEYDSLKIAALLQKTHGFVVTQNIAQADFIILNTCSVREKAQEKLFSDLGRIKKIKIKNPNLIVGVGGCVAAQEKKGIFARAPIVDIVFGPQTLHKLSEFYEQIIARRDHFIDVSFPALEKFAHLSIPQKTGSIASVSIMEGCNKFCSYCIVPYTRGREVSRPFEDVITEVKSLAALGAKEINLLGQNVNNYRGIMRSEKSAKTADLATLLYACAEIDGIIRLRFTTSHPAHFGAELIEAFANIPNLANHLHLPVQSGSNRILEAMRRGYTREEYIEKIAKLRSASPGTSISSDFIVGFPNETDEDFADTMDLIYTIGFDHSFSFVYSPRPQTKASQMEDNISLKEKKARLAILQQAINENAAKLSDAMVGTEQKIIITGRAKKDVNEYSGRTENNRIVNLSAENDITGEIARVKITAVRPNSLRGEML